MTTYSIRCSDGNTLTDLTERDLCELKDAIYSMQDFGETYELVNCDSGRRISMAADRICDQEKEGIESWLAEAQGHEAEVRAIVALSRL